MKAKLKEDKNREVREEQERLEVLEAQRKEQEMQQQYQEEEQEFSQYLAKIDASDPNADDKPSPALMKWAGA